MGLLNVAKIENYEAAKNLASIFSSIAIPIVLALASYYIQRSIADETLIKDYVGFAVNILKEDPQKQEKDIRLWAIKIVDDNSKFPLSNKAKDGLLSANIFSKTPFFSPPKECLELPDERNYLNDFEKLRKELLKIDSENHEKADKKLIEFIEKYLLLERDVNKLRANVECLQIWSSSAEKLNSIQEKSIQEIRDTVLKK